MKPPFHVGAEQVTACGRIERLIGRCEGRGGMSPAPQLRRENRIRTIQATVAIEGNSLSLEQVTAMLEGKRVRGPARDIMEVQNALAAYERVATLDPQSEADLLRAHGVLMRGLAADAGRYRRGNVGVLAGSRVAHVAPQAKRVPALMQDLFAFLVDADASPLIKACVFHYELEFIHPFSDGNGRAGRLWQHALLCAYSPVLAHVPTESLIKARQREYYSALAQSDRAGNADAFIIFMLALIGDALDAFAAGVRTVRPTGAARLEQAAVHFGKRWFTRKDYHALHGGISPATASRDLRAGVQRKLLRIEGDKATARYAFR